MTDLPSGTLTFLFTDVEGSTSLLRRLRDAYGPVMSDHHRLLRATFGGAGGQEVDAQGDSLFYAFASPTHAVHAAADAQRAVVAHSWPEGVELRVRIGIHTGEARLNDGRYVGLAVHRAARICAAGHGGQTLLSQTTKSLYDAEEYGPVDFSFIDLGEQPLKDFDRPVRIYQLTPNGLPATFPPLRTLATGTAEGPPTEPGVKEVPVPTNDGSRLRVLIVDDQALVRTGFRMILEAEPDMEVVGESADGRQAIDDARRLRPDVVLMDVRMPQLDGIEATRRLLAEDESVSKVVMLTTFDMDEYVYEALQAGASGFLLKDVPPEQLVSGIRAVCSGDALLAPSITRRVIEEFVRRPPDSMRATPPEVADLTEREVEVLRLIARGLSNAEIAKELYVSETTVKTHVARVLMKLRLRDRVQVVVFAYESGLVQAGA